jgi:hypothetical protein
MLRDEALLTMFRKAGLVHVSLDTEAAVQFKLDRFNKETTIEQNRKAIRLLRKVGIVTEAQFIVGPENETADSLQETDQIARDWNPDMANWSMYTPWPFSDLFQELGDKGEVFYFEKCNFATPIMKTERWPAAPPAAGLIGPNAITRSAPGLLAWRCTARAAELFERAGRPAQRHAGLRLLRCDLRAPVPGAAERRYARAGDGLRGLRRRRLPLRAAAGSAAEAAHQRDGCAASRKNRTRAASAGCDAKAMGGPPRSVPFPASRAASRSNNATMAAGSRPAASSTRAASASASRSASRE